MITKTATNLLAPTLLTLSGGLDSVGLTNKERKALIEKYNLSPDSNLVARNTGRALAGYLSGALSGRLLGLVPGVLDGNKLKATYGASLGSLIGGYAGSVLAAKKYSKARAEELLSKK